MAEMIKRQGMFGVRVLDKKLRTIRLGMTNEAPDSYNSVIKVAGWRNLDDYMRNNPVLLWVHDSKGMPVGRIDDIVQSAVNANGKSYIGLDGEAVFPDRRTYPFGYLVYDMYRKRFLRGSSVGFEPIDVQMIQDEGELERLGLKGPMGTVYAKQNLKELSAVPIPGNEWALAKELTGFVGQMRIGNVQVRTVPANEQDPKHDEAVADWLRDTMLDIKRAIDHAGSGGIITPVSAMVITEEPVVVAAKAAPEPKVVKISATSNSNLTLGERITAAIEELGEAGGTVEVEGVKILDPMVLDGLKIDSTKVTLRLVDEKREDDGPDIESCLDEMEANADRTLTLVSMVRDHLLTMKGGDPGTPRAAKPAAIPAPKPGEVARIDGPLVVDGKELNKKFLGDLFEMLSSGARKTDVEAIRADVAYVRDVLEDLVTSQGGTLPDEGREDEESERENRVALAKVLERAGNLGRTT